MQEKNIITKYALILAFYTAVAGGILAVTFSITEPQRKTNAKVNEIAAQKEVMPQAAKLEAFNKNGFEYYKAKDDDGKLIGYVFLTKGKGYSSIIEIMLGLDSQFKVAGLKIVSQTETPGLGTRIMENSFLQQFIGKAGQEIALKKDAGEIDAITGATISSRAVTKTINNAIEKLKKTVMEEKGNV
jgi:electron transport complex protein RnfG